MLLLAIELQMMCCVEIIIVFQLFLFPESKQDTLSVSFFRTLADCVSCAQNLNWSDKLMRFHSNK